MLTVRINRIGSQPTQISLYHPSKFSSNFRGYNSYYNSGYPGRGLQGNEGRLTEGALIIVVHFPHGVIEQIIVLILTEVFIEVLVNIGVLEVLQAICHLIIEATMAIVWVMYNQKLGKKLRRKPKWNPL